MCGIAGIAGEGAGGARDRAVLSRMLAALSHRGPDDEAAVAGEGFAIGARRLSIVDVERGRQPFATDDGSVVVAMNGEIYDHAKRRGELEARGVRFRTKADTEVLLRYRVLVGPGTKRTGDVVNRAQAIAGSERSNVARVKVRIVDGVFSDRGFIVGKVFADCDGDREQDRGEPGVPGVLLVLEDLYEIVWCSGWEDRANDHLPHLLGLGPYPHLEFGRRAAPAERDTAADHDASAGREMGREGGAAAGSGR